MLEWLFLLSFALPLIICLFLLPSYIKKAHKVGIVGIDVHKPNTPEIAESGGIVLVLAYLLGLFAFVPFIITNPVEASYLMKIVGTAATVLFSAFIGFIDDIYKTRWRLKILTPLLGGIPLAVLLLGRTTISTPFGVIDFENLGLIGLALFYFLILPFIVTACTNAVNMFAGLNGLEAGSSLIIASALIFLCAREELVIGAIILIPFMGAVIAFLLYNAYPSSVFPGDVGTFTMGAVVACVAVLANLERAVFIMFIPHTINAILFFIGKVKGEPPPRDASMNTDGTLPAPTIWSLRCIILRLHPMKEKTALYVLWIVVGVFAVAGTLAYGI